MKTQPNNNDPNSFITIVQNYHLEDMINFSKTIKVLYVDTDTPLRYDYYGIFKIFFHDIDVASTGDEGITYFENTLYDLIIISLQVQNKSGLEVIQEIKRTDQNTNIIALSSKEEHSMDLIRLGVDGYIIRPIEVAQFVQTIQKVLKSLQIKQILINYREELEYKNQELSLLNTQLNQLVKEEVEKNRQKDLKLYEQARIDSMADMLSNIAHQWRQPLSVISTAASGIDLHKKLGTLNDTILDNFIHKIDLSTSYLSNLIHIFREYIKDDEKEKEIILQDWIVQTLCLVYDSLLDNNIQLINTIEQKKKIKLKVKTRILSQVIINILQNAKDILLLRDIQSPWIHLDIETSNNTLLISIEDNGGGIDKNILSKIFEPYFTTKHQSQGTGLSLYLSYRIVVDNLDGKLYVQNTDNGAKFFIELPLNL